MKIILLLHPVINFINVRLLDLVFCTGITEKTSEKHINTMITIFNALENQQQQMNNYRYLATISQFLVQSNFFFYNKIFTYKRKKYL